MSRCDSPLVDIQYSLHAERRICPAELRRLYDHVGWWPDRDLVSIAEVLDQGLAVGAWGGDRLIGFARAVHDTKFRAFIEDVVVYASYRHRGVASRLLLCLLDDLSHIETISLFCDPAIANLYEALGFQRLSRSQTVLHCR